MNIVHSNIEQKATKILLNNEDYGINKINVAAIEKTDSLIWLGTEQGLIKFNSITKSIKRYQNKPGNTNSISNNKVYCVKKDSNDIAFNNYKLFF